MMRRKVLSLKWEIAFCIGKIYSDCIHMPLYIIRIILESQNQKLPPINQQYGEKIEHPKTTVVGRIATQKTTAYCPANVTKCLNW